MLSAITLYKSELLTLSA